MKKERLITNNNKKQFFLSMSKKQLISSLAVTTMLINPITSNAFANSNDILNSQNAETELTNTTEASTEGTLSRCTPDMNAGSLSRCAPDNGKGIVGNGNLKIPTQCDEVKTQSIQHTVPKPKDGKTTTLDRFMTYDCNRTGDEYIVRVNKTGDYDNHTYNYGDAGNNYTFNNFKVEYTVTTTDKYKDYPTTSKPGCHNIKGEKQVNFTVTTQDGATLGSFPGMQLDEKIEFNDAKHTVQYKFHCVASGGGQQFIDINLFPIEETVSNATNLESALNDESLNKVIINGEIKIDKPLTVTKSGATIVGENNGCINFVDKGSLVLKANDIKLSDLTIKKSAKAGIQVYKASGVKLNKVSVENSKDYGILVNASTVTLNNCSTSNNKSGGIMVCRATNILTKHSGKDSIVTVTGLLNQYESPTKPKVIVKNSRMIDVNKSNNISYYMQENKFISDLYRETQPKVQYKTFTEYYNNKDVQNALKGIKGLEEQYKDCKFEEKTIKYDVK